MSIELDITVYTDGGCLPNPGNGGCASILLCQGNRSTTLEKIILGCARNSTNNQMEITAVLNALQALKKPCKITIYSDSQYVVNTIGQWENGIPTEKGWITTWELHDWRKKKGPLLNADLWKLVIVELRRHLAVKMVWVKGHSDDTINIECDNLATKARESLLDKKAPEGIIMSSSWKQRKIGQS